MSRKFGDDFQVTFDYTDEDRPWGEYGLIWAILRRGIHDALGVGQLAVGVQGASAKVVRRSVINEARRWIFNEVVQIDDKLTCRFCCEHLEISIEHVRRQVGRAIERGEESWDTNRLHGCLAEVRRVMV